MSLRERIERAGMKVEPSTEELDRLTGKRLGPHEEDRGQPCSTSIFVDFPRRWGYLVVDWDEVLEVLFTGTDWEIRVLARL